MIRLSTTFQLPDDREAFLRGFEMGQLYQRISSPVAEPHTQSQIFAGVCVHPDNIECVRRMAADQKWQVETCEPSIYEPGWLTVILTLGPSKPRVKLSSVPKTWTRP
jgi:hypothetical protein